MVKGVLSWLERVFGKKRKDIARLQPVVEQVKAVRDQYRDLDDEQLRGKRDEFVARHEAGESLDELLPEAYGVVWEACRRLTERKVSWPVWGQEQTWEMVP